MTLKWVALLALLGIGLGVGFWALGRPKPAITEPPAPVITIPPPQPTPVLTKPQEAEAPISESQLTRGEAVGKGRFPAAFTSQMEVVEVDYHGFDGKTHRGQIVVHHEVAAEIQAIFKELLAAKWPIQRVIPIVKYDWSDDDSLLDNNTSAFNYRRTIGPGRGRAMSMHAFGRAIDINPYLNPFLDSKGRGESAYDPSARGTITRKSAPYKAFRKRGWRWGGDWAGAKDYQHFEKGSRTLSPRR